MVKTEKTKEISKLDEILDSLEKWIRYDPFGERLPGQLSTILKAKKELRKLRKQAAK